MNTITILLSGGIDSAACLHYLLEKQFVVSALHIDLGQPDNHLEMESAQDISGHYSVPLEVIKVEGVRVGEGYIIARNALLVILALMHGNGSKSISLGIHSGTDYVDCTPSFFDQMQRIVNEYADGAVSIMLPFLNWEKSDVLGYAKENGVPTHLAHTTNPLDIPPGFLKVRNESKQIG